MGTSDGSCSSPTADAAEANPTSGDPTQCRARHTTGTLHEDVVRSTTLPPGFMPMHR